MNPMPAQKSSLFKELAGAGSMLWLAALTCVLILLSAFLFLQHIVSDERDHAFASALDTNSKIVLSDEVRIRSLLMSLDKILLITRKVLADKPGLTRTELSSLLADLKIEGELNPHISFVRASGDIFLSSLTGGKGREIRINVADRQYFQKQLIGTEDLLDVGVPIESHITGKWVVPLTRRIVSKDGSFGGVVVMTVEPGLFSEPFEETSLGADASRAIIGLDGYTRIRINNGKLSFGGDNRKSQVFNELKKSKIGSYTAVATADGVNRLVSYRTISPYNILILAGSSVATIENVYRERVQGYIMASALFGVLILMMAGLLILGILRQRRVLESQQNLNQVIELVPQSIFRMDEQGKFLWVNRRTIDFAGPSAEEQALGFDWVLASVHPDDRSRLKDFVDRALRLQPNDQSCEYRKRRFDGAYLWFSSQITQVLDRNGAASSFLHTGTNIHDRKMAEERTRVTQKLESIGQLTGGMAHDFNNLLAIIVGNLDLLKPQVKVETDARRLEVAIGAAQRGVGLVKSLLALASKQPLLPARTDPWALVERIAPLLKHALGPRVNFVLNPPDAGVEVVVDEAGLEAVLLNLIVNARDAMPQGGDLTVSLGVSEGMARLAVADTGMGMPEAVRKRATEPFFTTKERGLGTGLGLSMVAGFVKQSGGTLKIHSAEGKGTTIEISLPVLHASPATPDTRLPVALVAAPAPLHAVVKLKILIVDDEPELAELVRAWVKDQGHTAVLASSAEDALALLEVRHFDVMLTDIMMPGHLDGIGLAQKVSASRPAMKIFLMSGYSKETAKNRADIPWPLLVKPFRREDFDAALTDAFAVSKPADLSRG